MKRATVALVFDLFFVQVEAFTHKFNNSSIQFIKTISKSNAANRSEKEKAKKKNQSLFGRIKYKKMERYCNDLMG